MRTYNRRRYSNTLPQAPMPLRLPTTASALALVMALSAPAGAQQQGTDAQSPAETTPAKKEALEEVVVTGIRASLESSQSIKQNAEQIVDSVTAEDIGALPDRSVAEALQRIPGVTLQRTDSNRDPARLSAEGGGVFVRGLSWVRSELNGRDIFSANDGRNIGFQDVSADLLAGIDVYKTPTADMVEGGVGGTVNLRTRLPLDSGKPLLAFSGDYNYGDLMKHGFYSGNALYSNSWVTGIGRVGALVSGSLGNEGNRTDMIQLGNYVPQVLGVAEGGMAAGSTVLVPNSIGWRRVDWQQERTALAAAFQWEPSDRWLYTLQAFQAKAKPQDLEYTEGDYGAYVAGNTASGGPGTTTQPYTGFTGSGVVTSGTVGVTPQLDTRYELSHHTTNDLSLDGKFRATDRLTFTGDVQYVKSHADIVSMTGFTQMGNASGNSIPTTITFDIGGNNPSLALSQPANQMANAASYWWAAAMDHIEDNDAHEWAERLDGEFKFTGSPWLEAFRFGVRATDKAAITRESGWNWGLLSHQYWGGGAPAFLSSTPGYASQLYPFLGFFRGNIALPSVGVFPSFQLVRNGTAYAYSVLRATETAGWGWTPRTTDWSKYTPGGDNPNSGINDQTEHTYAGYALQRFTHDHTPLGPMDGNLGVRLVRTEEMPNQGVLVIPPLANAMTPAACVAAHGAAACQFLTNVVNFVGAGDTQFINVPNNTYTDVLPTFNLRFLLQHDLQLRFAAGKAMVRPTFSQMMPFTTYSFKFAGDGYSPAPANSATSISGNPELKPTRVKQLDSSLEWYFAPTGSLTFDAFYKHVSDYEFAGNTLTPHTNNGTTFQFLDTRNVNGPSGKIRGFELAYQQFFDFLPSALRGLGFQSNLTLVDSAGGANTALNLLDTPELTHAGDNQLPLEGMSRWSYNATLMYERPNRLSARLAWNWRERYLLTTSAANINAPVWMENYGQLDGEVFFNITEGIKVGAQATNLLNRRTYLDVGGEVLAPRYSWNDTDRRFALAVRATF